MLAYNTIHQMDCLRGMKMLRDASVQCCVTSPPYWGLRDYGIKEQYGLESSPEEYVVKMIEVFAEVKRVLKPDGTLWLNIGDSYWGSGKSGNNPLYQSKHTEFGKPSIHTSRFGKPTTGKHPFLKPKDLIGLPWMVAFALRNDGWYLRQDIIWNKPNPMPESTRDRCTKAHEYIFLLSKESRYYFDQPAIKTLLKDSSVLRIQQDLELQKGSDRVPGKTNGPMKARVGGRKPRLGIDVRGGNQGNGHIPMSRDGKGVEGHSGYFKANGDLIGDGTANKRSVWTINTKPFKEAHFATYPEELIVDCIKAGSKENDLVLDPFMGAGTTALVAALLYRKFIGFELNPEYIKIANRRLQSRLGLFYSK